MMMGEERCQPSALLSLENEAEVSRVTLVSKLDCLPSLSEI